eukprot:CFRG6973T1
MPIIYATVSRGPVVLAEHTTSSGNFTQITQIILDKIPPHNAKMSYIYDRYLFHYIVQDGYTYLCMANEEFQRRIAFAFLVDIQSRFQTTLGMRANTAGAYSLNTSFQPVLQTQMEYFSFNPNADRIVQVQGEIDEVKKVMVENIEKVLERGEHIELLVDRTETLNQQAFHFKKKANVMKRQLWWKNKKYLLIIIMIVLAVVYILFAWGCGGPTLPCLRKNE